MNKRMAFILAMIILLCTTVPALADDTWVCPTCGAVNPIKANFCPVCVTPQPHNEPESVESNAWLCPDCGNISSINANFCMICAHRYTGDEQGALLIEHPSHDQEIFPVGPQIDEYHIDFTSQTTVSFPVYAESEGNYCVWATEMTNNYWIYAEFQDPYGQRTNTYSNESLNMNRVLRDSKLKAGTNYTLTVRPDLGLGEAFRPGSLNLHIGHPRSAVDITGYDVVHDEFSFRSQSNYYSFTPPVSGIYAFYCTEANAGVLASITVTDWLNNKVPSNRYDTSIGMGQYVSYELEGGRTYLISAVHSEGYSNQVYLGIYTLLIGYPDGQTYDITGCGAVGDSFYYPDQEARYVYTAPVTGDYKFNINSLNPGADCHFQIFDSLGNRVSTSGWSSAYALNEGRQYTIVISNGSNSKTHYQCDYALMITRPD